MFDEMFKNPKTGFAASLIIIVNFLLLMLLSALVQSDVINTFVAVPIGYILTHFMGHIILYIGAEGTID